MERKACSQQWETYIRPGLKTPLDLGIKRLLVTSENHVGRDADRGRDVVTMECTESANVATKYKLFYYVDYGGSKVRRQLFQGQALLKIFF